MSFIKEVSIGNNVYDIRDKNALNTSNISNCLLEIPQDIKLELNNGTLTLKAGSKVYIPNGFESDGATKKFDVVNIQSDITVDSPYTNEPIFIYYRNNAIEQAANNAQCSGTSNTVNYGYWYDTTNNFIKRINAGEAVYPGVSFPLTIINASNGSWVSIDQVFNGFGYIGSTVFALPGVKGRIPNGRNADGSLKSIEFTTSSVLTHTYTDSRTATIVLRTSDGISAYTDTIYDEENNITKNTSGNNQDACHCGKVVYSSGKVTSFTPKTVFHALDYNDKSTISGWSMPSSRYIDLTLGASGSTYTAPANGWFSLWLKDNMHSQGRIVLRNEITKFGYGIGVNNNMAGYTDLNCPVSKGTIVTIYYEGTTAPSSYLFRFIYAEGEYYNPVSSSNSDGHDTIIPDLGGGETGPEEPLL